MKVSELIKKLQKMPQDAEVAVNNDRMFEDGTYKASRVECEDNIVMISTFHIWKLEDGKWCK